MEFKLKKIPLYIKLIYQFIDSYGGNKNALFFSPEETAENIINQKKSFIRFGDGEFDIIEGKSIHYQEYDKKLSNILDYIIRDYISNSRNCNYIVGMPSKYLKCKGREIANTRVKISSWSHVRYYFNRNYDKNIMYGDSFLFAKGLENIYGKIWNDESVKKVIFVHNNPNYAIYFENKYNIETEFIKIPSKNSFDNYEDILSKIISKIKDDKRRYIVLVSAGPCGKVLCFDLTKEGIWAIDTGHCWDNPLIISEIQDGII